MKLSLDYTQRLNLHALMGTQRASVDDIRLFWRLQDLINLTADEKAAINYRTVPQANGTVQVQWDARENLPVLEYEFQAEEFQRLGKMFKEWQSGFLIGPYRPWLEPLLNQLDGAVNGKPAL